MFLLFDKMSEPLIAFQNHCALSTDLYSKKAFKIFRVGRFLDEVNQILVDCDDFVKQKNSGASVNGFFVT